MKIEKCKLCVAKLQVGTYECVIFNKKLDDTYQSGSAAKSQGKLKPAYQECILRSELDLEFLYIVLHTEWIFHYK